MLTSLLPGSAWGVPWLCSWLLKFDDIFLFFCPGFSASGKYKAPVGEMMKLPWKPLPSHKKDSPKDLMPSSIFKCLLAGIIALSYIEELHTELQTFFKEKYLKGSTFHLRFQTGCSFLNPAGLSKEKSGLPTFITRMLSRRKDSQRSLINARNTQRATFVPISVKHLINNARFSNFYYYTIYAVHFPLLPFGNPSFTSLKQNRQSY